MTDFSSVLVRDHRNLFVTPPPSDNFLKTVPPGIYKFNVSPKLGPFLEISDLPELPPKLYGDLEAYTARVMKTFKTRNKNTGVMFSGDKGSGKSLLTKNIMKAAVDAGIAVIEITFPASGQLIANFVSQFNQPFVLAFDEFEKVYKDEDAKSSLLPFLDGTTACICLSLFTVNEKTVSPYMLNRPGRVFYHRNFSGLTIDFIYEYSLDNLIDKTKVSSIVLSTFTDLKLSFDTLQAIIEEMNRYGETFGQAVKYIGYTPTKDFSSTGDIRVTNVTVKGQPIHLARLKKREFISSWFNTSNVLQLAFFKDPSIHFPPNPYPIPFGPMSKVLDFMTKEEFFSDEETKAFLEAQREAADEMKNTFRTLDHIKEDGKIEKKKKKDPDIEPAEELTDEQLTELISQHSKDPKFAPYLPFIKKFSTPVEVVSFVLDQDFKEIDLVTGELVFVNKDGDVMKIHKKVQESAVFDPAVAARQQKANEIVNDPNNKFLSTSGNNLEGSNAVGQNQNQSQEAAAQREAHESRAGSEIAAMSKGIGEMLQDIVKSTPQFFNKK